MNTGFLPPCEDRPAAPRLGTARILPIPYDRTTSGLPGARFGPVALLAAGRQLEGFDEELAWDLTRHVDLAVEEPLPSLAGDPREMMEAVRRKARELLRRGDFLLSVGGEHSLTAPLALAHRDRFGPLTVVQVDAHADLRDTYEGTPHSHGCVMRRILEAGLDAVQIAIRSMSGPEHRYLAGLGAGRSRLFTAAALRDPGNLEALLAFLARELRGPVYLSVDVDGLDPSVIPATGTPEPGGLSWAEACRIVDVLAGRGDLVGADVMELAPRGGLFHAEVAAARLVHRILGRVFHRRLAAAGRSAGPRRPALRKKAGR